MKLIGNGFATACLNRGLVPETELLFFARPKKSNQKKGRPAARHPLRFSHQPGIAREAIPGLAGEDAHPCAPPSGLVRLMLRCSARHDGTKRQHQRNVNVKIGMALCSFKRATLHW